MIFLASAYEDRPFFPLAVLCNHRLYTVSVLIIDVLASVSGGAEMMMTSPLFTLKQPWVWSVSDFIFLATAYEGGWPVLSPTVLSSHRQSAVSVLIIAKAKYTNHTVSESKCVGKVRSVTCFSFWC